jgi:hypothetical protein
MTESISLKQVLTINPKTKAMMQRYLDLIIRERKFNNGYGTLILKYVNHFVVKHHIHRRYSEFEIEYVIKPYMVDRLLLKAKNYNKETSEAMTFVKRVCDNSLRDAIRAVNKMKGDDYTEVFYTDEMFRFDFREDYQDEMNMIEAPEIIITNLKVKYNGKV